MIAVALDSPAMVAATKVAPEAPRSRECQRSSTANRSWPMF
jgi:hypothetical protein